MSVPATYRSLRTRVPELRCLESCRSLCTKTRAAHTSASSAYRSVGDGYAVAVKRNPSLSRSGACRLGRSGRSRVGRRGRAPERGSARSPLDSREWRASSEYKTRERHGEESVTALLQWGCSSFRDRVPIKRLRSRARNWSPTTRTGSTWNRFSSPARKRK